MNGVNGAVQNVVNQNNQGAQGITAINNGGLQSNTALNRFGLQNGICVTERCAQLLMPTIDVDADCAQRRWSSSLRRA